MSASEWPQKLTLFMKKEFSLAISRMRGQCAGYNYRYQYPCVNVLYEVKSWWEKERGGHVRFISLVERHEAPVLFPHCCTPANPLLHRLNRTVGFCTASASRIRPYRCADLVLV
jgi:hypothetical protein